MTTFSFEIDPHSVLGVPTGATLQEIREAYRTKAKQFHPDAGGEAWAFRILVRSYEVLSTARVARASQSESPARPEPRNEWRQEPRFDRSNAETVWPGDSEQPRDPSRIVDVEKLWVRFEVDHIWLLRDDPNDTRFLSCCLSFTWPSSVLAEHARSIPGAEKIVHELHAIFDAMCVQTRVISSRCQDEEGQFSGWLSYPNAGRAASALTMLRTLLGQRGYGIRAWNRDLIIPRDWK